jgi:hypothetical protein
MGNGSYPLANKHGYWKWPIYSWFTYETLLFPIAMLVYQRGHLLIFVACLRHHTL